MCESKGSEKINQCNQLYYDEFPFLELRKFMAKFFESISFFSSKIVNNITYKIFILIMIALNIYQFVKSHKRN